MYNYYEPRLIKPRLKKLQNLLEENPYRGRECEGDEEDKGRKVRNVFDIFSAPSVDPLFQAKID